jgi:hypothetical protein
MNESQLYEKIGRTQTAYDALDAEYTKLIQVLAQVVQGGIARSRVLVDLTNRRFEVAAPEQSPSLPATINGLPVCVVAPLESEPVTAAGGQ